MITIELNHEYCHASSKLSYHGENVNKSLEFLDIKQMCRRDGKRFQLILIHANFFVNK